MGINWVSLANVFARTNSNGFHFLAFLFPIWYSVRLNYKIISNLPSYPNVSIETIDGIHFLSFFSFFFIHSFYPMLFFSFLASHDVKIFFFHNSITTHMPCSFKALRIWHNIYRNMLCVCFNCKKIGKNASQGILPLIVLRWVIFERFFFISRYWRRRSVVLPFSSHIVYLIWFRHNVFTTACLQYLERKTKNCTKKIRIMKLCAPTPSLTWNKKNYAQTFIKQNIKIQWNSSKNSFFFSWRSEKNAHINRPKSMPNE